MRTAYTELYPWNNNGKKETKEFLERVTQILIKYVEATNDRKTKVVDFVHPEELMKKVDLSLPADGYKIEQLFKDCEAALKWQVKTG